MDLFTFISLLAAITTGARAVPIAGELESTKPSSVPPADLNQKERIILLTDDCPHPEAVMERMGFHSNQTKVRHTFSNSAFHGFAATMHGDAAKELEAMSDVAQVEEAVDVESLLAKQDTREDTTWGLQRMSSKTTVRGDPYALQYTYEYADDNLGGGVDIYVVDSGIYTQHQAFGGRARMGFSFMKDTTDGYGHGTHVAGTAAAAVFGVASNANVIGVKVLGADGAGSSSDTVAGMDYVIRQHDAQKAKGGDFKGSIMSMSWGLKDVSPSIDKAIKAAAKSGVHVTVAAGNSGDDACSTSPSHLGGSENDDIVSVGAINEDDSISKFSNTGSCVDIYAPGQNIVSAYPGNPNTIHPLSGTSMATPHVTGLMANLMSGDSKLANSPVALKAKILEMAEKGAVHGKTYSGDKKLLLSNGLTDPTGTEGIMGDIS
ncbi:MAG: hypothetical protein M1831_004499 [Alyxoria varia]|nr:MAG: hypothetical protein M1831_004499 [Alyxoria varia]